MSSQDKKQFIDLVETSNHTVLYQLDENSRPYAYPINVINKWDENHVRMPYSPLSFHPVESNERKSLISRWHLIENSLKNEVTNIYEMKESIMRYNTQFESHWNFDVIIDMFENELNSDYKQEFFSITYPGMIKLVLNLPNFVTKPIPLLKSQKMHSISLSQMQIASLLANAFFCTFPRRNRFDDDSEYRNFPRINFSSLFNTTRYQRNSSNRNKIEKLKCILHYFKRVVRQMPEGVVTFTRRVLNNCDRVNWVDSNHKFDDILLEAHSDGSIFSIGIDSIKIDFANKFVGGGVLNNGCVQEEILFVTQPELMVSGLFTEMLNDNECLVVQGTELFVIHTGYSRTFLFKEDFNENTNQLSLKDKFGRWKNTISMIDAVPFRGRDEQFSKAKILRDLDKAYCGFSDTMPTEDDLPQSVSTGNWGCGAFGGDVYLKFILQIIACSQLKKNLIYYTFDNIEFENQILDIFKYLKDSKCSIGSLCECLFQYCELTRRPKLFDYIKSCDKK